MNVLWVVSTLGALVLRDEAGCEAMTLNAVPLCQLPLVGGASGCGPSHRWRRKRRSWVWNQFFVLEEFTGDEPLYVGKVQIFDYSQQSQYLYFS